MIEPSPAELLAGVADALEESVLPDLERGPARNQIMAAIGIVRRCGRAFDNFGAVLHADCLDLAATLGQAVAADPALSADPARSAESANGAATAADIVSTNDIVFINDVMSANVGARTVDHALTASAQLLGSGYPSVAQLSALHDDLSEALAQVLLAAQRLGSGQLPALRQLLSRMAERESQLGLSPW